MEELSGQRPQPCNDFRNLQSSVNCVGQRSTWRSLPDTHPPELMLAALALKRRAKLVTCTKLQKTVQPGGRRYRQR